MKPSFYILCALLFALVKTSFAQPASVTLEQCLQEAARYSTRLRMSREQIVAQRALAQDASAARLPMLSASGSYNYTSEVAALDIALPVPGVPPIHREFGDGNIYDFALTARAPLFTGGTLRERVLAEQSALRATERDLAADSLRMVYDVRRAYFYALGADKRVAIAERAVNRLDRHLTELHGAKNAGMASDEMLIQTEARLRQSEGAALTAVAEAKAARLQLASLIGRPGQEITPADALEQPITADEQTVAWEHRHEIAATTARQEQSRHLTRAARGSFLPTLSAQAAYHYGKPGVDQFTNEWMDYATVGVNLSWTLWDWNSRSAKVAQARAGMRTLEARHQELLDALQTRLSTANENLRAARETLAKSDERVALERRRFELMQGRYRIGSGSESEYLDAQDDLTAAELDRDSAAVRLRIAEAEWLNAAGR